MSRAVDFTLVEQSQIFEASQMAIESSGDNTPESPMKQKAKEAKKVGETKDNKMTEREPVPAKMNRDQLPPGYKVAPALTD
jgi:hypothetical protein